MPATRNTLLRATPHCYALPCTAQNPLPNAYTLAIAGRKPFIVIHTALLELLSPQELQVGQRADAQKGVVSRVDTCCFARIHEYTNTRIRPFRSCEGGKCSLC